MYIVSMKNGNEIDRQYFRNEDFIKSPMGRGCLEHYGERMKPYKNNDSLTVVYDIQNRTAFIPELTKLEIIIQ